MVQFGVVLSLCKRCFVKLLENTSLLEVDVRLAGVLYLNLGKLKRGR